SAGVGALLTLLLLKTELNIYGFVGVIMLVGILKKNPIMIIDFASGGRAARRRRLSRVRIALQADHDDDDGRAARHLADRARHRRRRRRPPRARPGRRRGPARLAAAAPLP